MPHTRLRFILPLTVRRLKLWPVVGLLGARQTGKSTLLRELLPKAGVKTEYTTLDSISARDRATRAPEAFSQPQKNVSRVFDEIQKTPDLFDALKLHVDSDRRPGMFLISGSTQFSNLTGIRESLTGRIGLLRMYPLCRGELFGHPLAKTDVWTSPQIQSKAVLNLTEYDRLLSRGGMPGICFLRSDEEFQATARVWFETTCSRDLQQVGKRTKYDGALATAILVEVAKQVEPTALSIGKKLRKDTRIIQSHLDALEAILVLHRLAPHSAGIGKAQYLLLDCGLIAALGGTREQQIKAQLLNELLVHSEARGLGLPVISTFRNEKTSRVPLIAEWPGQKTPPLAIHFYEGETLPRAEREALLTFARRAEISNLRLAAFLHISEGFNEGGIEHLSLRG